MLRDVEAALIELSNHVRVSLAKLNGPLRNALRDLLHDPVNLPDATCYDLAADAIDVLHEAQQLIEPRASILADHFLGYTNSKCLNAAVERGIPDILASEKYATIKQLSQVSNTRPDRLQQILRTLYNNGIFHYDKATGLYKNNDASAMLCKTHTTQWRNWVMLYGNQFYDIARGIPESTLEAESRSAAQINYSTNCDMFTYFQQQGWTELLHSTLGGIAEAMAPGIVNDYPWTDLADGATVVLDVGGGGGGLISTLLRHFKQLRGAVFDLPHVIDHAKPLFHNDKGKYADVSARVLPEHLIGGDFFESVPSFEVYTMKWVLHDWNDEKSLIILRNIRKAIKRGPKSRLIIMEAILADGRSSRLSRYADINMMMTAKGQERTKPEWRELALRSGWDVRAIYTLRNAWFKAIELVPTVKPYDNTDHYVANSRRLARRHEWIRHAMGGDLSHFPIDYLNPALRVLASGPADWRWLENMAAMVPNTATLVWADTEANAVLMPSSLPPNMNLVRKSITEPWPAGFHQSFDVASQRMTLEACDSNTAQAVVCALFSLVKPGGWIQLLECDHSGGFTAEQRLCCPRTAELCDLVVGSMNAMGKSNQHCHDLKGYLRAAGAIDIVKTIMVLPVGASKALTTELQASTTQDLLSVVDDLREANQSDQSVTASQSLDEKYFDILYRELAEELTSRGSTQRFCLVYGRRPRNC